ncbi:MAG: hypothetical protein V3V56_00005 [bacterium]
MRTAPRFPLPQSRTAPPGAPLHGRGRLGRFARLLHPHAPHPVPRPVLSGLRFTSSLPSEEVEERPREEEQESWLDDLLEEVDEEEEYEEEEFGHPGPAGRKRPARPVREKEWPGRPPPKKKRRPHKGSRGWK